MAKHQIIVFWKEMSNSTLYHQSNALEIAKAKVRIKS